MIWRPELWPVAAAMPGIPR
ncbi:hypothetical protein Tco_1572190, partial [Tanacetum coccineum]